MGPDPFNMPSFGSAQNYSGMLDQEVAQAAPLATSWHGPLTGPNIQQVYNQVKAPAATGGTLSQFGHFLGGTVSQIGHIAGGAASWLGKQAVGFGEGLTVKPAEFAYDFTTGAYRTFEESNQENQLDSKQQNLTNLYKSGQINAKEYQSGLNGLLSERNQLTSSLKITQQRLSNSQSEGVDTASSLITLATAGVGSAPADAGEVATTQYLKSASADDFFSAAESAINRAASDPAVFEGLTPSAQKAVQIAAADVVSQSSGQSASQLARATAMNLAFKYPVYFNYLSSTGKQLYTELDQNKYGQAVRTLAFNAALLLSGGPIGKALEATGGVAKAVSGAMFGEGSFIDQLSQGIGNGDPGGLVAAIQKLPEEDQADAVKQLSAVQATNMAAVGNDPAAAAVRVLNGMESYEGVSMTQFSHEEALNNMVNFAKAQRIASDAGKAAGINGITVGRVDAAAKNYISSQLSPAIDSGKDTAHNVWDALKGENPNAAWANNENFDRQVKSLINKYDDASSFDSAMRNIKASAKIKGIPAEITDQLSKMGYIPITPSNLEAPFTEGSGKLATKFSGSNDFFTHAVEPLPILSFLGDALTSVGLSPNASSARVYQIFNDNLAQNLKEVGVQTDFLGEDKEQSTDTLIKKLSDYAHNPTAGKLMSKTPVTDLRMLTTKDVQAALKVSASDARRVQDAISQSYLQVPVAIRGLGDRAVDLLYKAGPIASAERRYARIQGAARFTWNPFFQYLRVAPKTEILSELEGGGFVKSIFAGQAGELNSIRSTLREGGFLDQPGSLRAGDVVSGEAADYMDTGKNLNKRLLPMQERSIAGLISSEAERVGVDAKTYIQQFPQEVRDTIQAIASYDKHSNFLNSPLARTMNVAFFPFRFEAKVAGVMTRSLAKTSLMTQVSVVNGMMKAHQWLNSPEGMAWYSRNSQAIGFFEYITPAAELNQVFESLLPGHDHSLGNFGELGGLPFGFIPQLLDAEGLTHFNQPAVNAANGQIFSSYIPASTKGQMAIAIQDFLGTLYSYPGEEMGMPSKTSIDRGVALGVTGGNKKTDLQLNTPSVDSLSMQQQNFLQAVQQAHPGTQPPPQNPAQTGQPMVPQPNQTEPGVQVPAGLSPAQTTPTKTAKSAKTTKTKKGQFIPQALPGQTQLGQL